jgi:tetratricopeptide (TPR) repeat protein
MSNEKSRSQQPAHSATPATKISPPTSPPSGRVPPLFRSIDWLTFLVTFGFVWLGYYLTLAPALTLEDSGELATGSFYAGIPHPPGYPVWTIYTWLWTLLPFGNVAWRVALGEATGGALAAGLLGLLVSRGSSMLMEGIEDLKAMAGRWESAICMVSGFVAGGLIGYNGFMWSQSVIVEVYSFSVASLVAVLLFLLRWIYAPHQRRYLYLALFFHGICFTNHQTLIVAAMGIEVAIAAADFRLGRYLFLGNSIIFICGLILKQAHVLTALEANNAIFIIFIVVGLCSIAAYLWFAVLTKETFQELCLDASISAFFILTALKPALGFFSIILALAALVAMVKFARDTRKLGVEWLVVMICGLCWIAGAAFYFYMPLAGMTNPPMQWGYPRTVEGFIHAFTRGQYEKTNPTNIIGDPLRFLVQLQMMGRGIVDEFSWLYAFLALVPFFFYRKLHRRERAWLIGITAIYLCLGVLLLILLNPPPDRAAQELVRVFFTASHTLIALLVGYGLTLVAAYMATHYQKVRSWGLIGGGLAFGLALLSFAESTHSTYFGENSTLSIGKFLSFIGSTFTNKDQYGLPVFAGLMLMGITVVFVVALLVYRNRAPLAITLGAFTLMPFYSVMTHWSDNEQRNHFFGYWFGHDMFSPPFKDASGKPIYPEMAKDAVLYGGTDPGRFCPTYMIFCDSLLPDNCKVPFDPKFDRRDVYIITQNALADGTYLNYIRAHYNRSAQIDPPFFQELARPERERQENYETNFLARAIEPLDNLFEGIGASVEERRRTFTSWFSEDQFTDFPGFLARLKDPQQDAVSKFILENLAPRTQQLLSGGDTKALRNSLIEDLNRILDRELESKEALMEAKAKRDKLLQSGEAASSSRLQSLEKEIADLSRREPLYTPERFKNVEISDYLADFIKQNPQSFTRIRLNRLLLEAAYPNAILKSKGGVYPDREIYIATPEDSARCFQDYLADAQRRLQVNQLRPGEDVKIVDNRVQVSGQVAVMAINGLITKVMFDHNPKNEFYVEESFPLEWMYRYLTPFGVIMKINREPLTELSEEVVRKDHEFWTQYSERLIGNWVTYDTPVKEIADFVEKVYLRRDFSGFKGDRKFIRDDQAQKAFSKLRSSIGGLYAWRVNDAKPGSPEQQRMLKEADFAFRQALAFCPYSPEAVFRYVNLLLSHQRFDEALIVVKTCLKLDPFNGQVMGLKSQLENFRGGQPTQAQAPQDGVPQLEKRLKDNPRDVQAAFNLASAYLQLQQTNSAYEVLDRALEISQTNVGTVLAIAQAWAQLGNYAKLEATLEKLAKAAPDSPEAWYDLAAVKATLNKPAEAIPALKNALETSSNRLARDSKSRDLRNELKQDPRFSGLRTMPEFQKLTQSP